MKSSSWLLLVMNSLDPIRTFRMEKRTLIILGCGGIFFACAFAFFAYGYFTLFYERNFLAEQVKELTNRVATLEQVANKTSPGGNSPAAISSPITIESLKITPRGQGRGFGVGFRLIHQNPNRPTFSGLLVMVAKNETLKSPIYRSIPDMPLDKGVPLQPEKGRRFDVQGQKFVEAYFDAEPNEVFKNLTVYIYSPEGKMILQKSAEIPGKE
jgi:hypothetical protein